MLDDDSSSPLSNGPSLLSDVSGRIKHIFFAVPSYDPRHTAPLVECLRGIRDALGPDVRASVMRRPADAANVDDQLSRFGDLDTMDWEQGFVLRLRDMEATVEGTTLRVTRLALPDFTNWVQDPFLIALENGRPRVWASPLVKRQYGGWDDELPKRLAQHLDWPIEMLPRSVEAGNVLVDEHVVLVGADVPNDFPEWPALQQRLESGGREVIVVGEAPQPIFHIDLYVTLAGQDRKGNPLALVGSVKRASELANEPLADDDRAVEEKLDAVAATLFEHGYTVKRLPLVPVQAGTHPEGFWLSYNNCLVQSWTDERGWIQRVVILPEFGSEGDNDLKVFDDAASGTWNALGFDVRFAHGPFATLAECGGGVRCMTKVLVREGGGAQ